MFDDAPKPPNLTLPRSSLTAARVKAGRITAAVFCLLFGAHCTTDRVFGENSGGSSSSPSGDVADSGLDAAASVASGSSVESTGGTQPRADGGGTAEVGTAAGGADAGAPPSSALECEPDQPVCDGKRATFCNSRGDGFTSGGDVCTSDQTCTAGTCADHVCKPSEDFCSGNTVRRCSADGLSSEEIDECEAGSYCETSSATCKSGVCSPDQPACDDTRATFCNSEGSGFVSGGTTCGQQQTCDAGICKDHVCTPGEDYCVGSQSLRCSDDGLASSTNEECSAPTPACFGNGQCGECMPDAERSCGECADGTEICSSDGEWMGCEDAGTEYSCVPDAPDGWSGPVVKWAGPGSAPECPQAYESVAYSGNTDLDPGTHTCSACKCDEPSTCPTDIWAFFRTGGCDPGDGTGEVWGLGALVETNKCYSLPWLPVGRYGQYGGSNSGTQTPSGGVPTTTTPTFETSVRLCSSADALATCSSGNVCAPVARGTFEDSPTCIYRAGDHACPAAYPEETVYHASFSDDRDCASCTCNGSCGTRTERIYSTTDCSGSPTTRTLLNSSQGSQCFETWVGRSVLMVTSGASFNPMGGQKLGAVVPTGPTTVCCTE